ncbi:ribonuclease H2 subunit B-like [Eriocheir sinensis]|uniref:ribonuclease H2 subunit B-like n=1 Tax=Eriocheir sinensis TaxID=95602 RepID=UPI0021CA07CC|nr:ribonuclease H2 subunit B-like [Eriocheir sinensis]
MPRSPSKRGQQAKDCATLDNSTKSQHKITFLPNELLSSGSAEVLRLCDPRTDAGAMYVLDKDKKTLHEIKEFDEGHRSWFLGQAVESNGKLYIISPMDVTFLILPYLMKSTRVVPLDHLLEDEQFPDVSSLEAVVEGKDLSHVAESKGSRDLCAWKYSEENTLAWLSGRVAKLATLLEEKKVPTSTAQALTFVKPMDPRQAKEAYTVLAHGIISEYLSEGLAKTLHMHLKLPDRQIKPKAKPGEENVPPKKMKMSGPTEDYSKDGVGAAKAPSPMTAKEKALAKSAAGSKSIMSFFAKK